MQQRHQEILKEMSASGRTPPNLSKELGLLSNAVSLFEHRQELEDEKLSVAELLDDAASDKEMERECREELSRLETDIISLEKRIVEAVLPKDMDDFDSDAIVEIKAGTGGEEAGLFAFELFEAYERIAKSIGFRSERMSCSMTEMGGMREGSLLVSGGQSFQVSGNNDSSLLGPYGAFKFESGVHRVQRIPLTDKSRVHTSACSVAVMPSFNDRYGNGETIPESELKVETMRASGAGGQHVNTTDSAVRVTHIPTGIQASIQDERSQHKNKEKALKLITARVRDTLRGQAAKERGTTRSQLMGGGDRSERIRTYNFPQDRITDHRCKETRNGIPSLLSGKTEDNLVSSFFPFLSELQREELLLQIEQEHNASASS